METTTSLRPFHLAIPVNNLERDRIFYRDILGCTEGRSSDHWVDFNFFGHQLVLHEKKEEPSQKAANPVDGKQVPIPHFGVVLTMESFKEFSDRLQAMSVEFVIAPYIRFEGQPGEQATMFLLDPSDNAIELKSFQNPDQLFAK